MASTINLMQTILWTGPYVHYQPLAIGGPEPAISNANLIKSAMLGPPFTWPWNRNEPPAIELIQGTQDYTAALSDFGFIEKAWVNDGTETKEIEVKRTLSKDTSQGRPEYVSVQLDDNAGNITFRFMPCPDQDYTFTPSYQQKATPFTSLANRWNPIPDELAYIFQPGFLAMSMLVPGDSRFPIFNDRFVSHLLGAQDGLDEMQKSIFIGNWTDVMRQVAGSQMKNQQGIGGRGK
jgi:hypothetical protein